MFIQSVCKNQFLGLLGIKNGDAEKVERNDIGEVLLVAKSLLWAINSYGDQR